jgi:bacillopeptidase F (M6 metalloprotease family)
VSGGTYNAGTRVVSFPVNFTAAGTQNFVFTVNVNTGSYYAPITYLNEQVPTSTVPATLTPTSTTTSVWSVSTGQSNSAPNAMFTPDPEGVSEQMLTTTNTITLGANQSSLSFWHSFSTEPGFDGGVIEISTNNGTSWTDLGSKFITGYYNASIDPTNGIPISGKPAFTGQTAGFINTKVNLSTYEGLPVKFRWAFYSDLFESAPGWYVDDILVKK